MLVTWRLQQKHVIRVPRAWIVFLVRDTVRLYSKVKSPSHHAV